MINHNQNHNDDASLTTLSKTHALADGATSAIAASRLFASTRMADTSYLALGPDEKSMTISQVSTFCVACMG